MADSVERVTVTHLQIPLKEPFRISGGEVSVKDAILVAVETRSGIGIGESSPMALGFGEPALYVGSTDSNAAMTRGIRLD